MLKSRAWYYRFPGDAGAFGPMRFAVPVTEREARARLRAIYGVKRLSAGTEVWPYTKPVFGNYPGNTRIQFL